MALPNISIVYQNGALATVEPSEDGLFGVVANAVAVASTFALDTPYLVTGMTDVAALGIADTIDNHRLYKFLSEFYAEAGTGTPLYVMGVARSIGMSGVFTLTVGTAPVHKLLDTANGKIRGVFTVFHPDNSWENSTTAGLEADVMATKQKAQQLADDYTTAKRAPFFVITEGYDFTGNVTLLTDLTTDESDRVGIVIGDTEKRTGATASKGAAVGILAGRLAKSAVHVNPGKVRDGKLSVSEMFIVDTPPELANVGAIHDKGYISFRTHQSKAGYFVTDDPLSCAPSNDYRQLTHRRTIDKAYRIAYATLVDFLLDDVQLTASGTISPVYAKTVEGQVIAAIKAAMSDNGELSVDQTNKDDAGVICKVDLTEVSASTSRLRLSALQVRPKGHNRFIDVPLGFIPIT